MSDDRDQTSNIYQLAGIDDRERGFNRQVHIRTDGERYRAILRYETLQVEGAAEKSEDAALRALVRDLHRRGYMQIRTQLIFRAGRYLGSQEPWEEHPDPRPSRTCEKFWARLKRIFRRGSVACLM